MAALRAFLLLFALIGFFLIGAPLQWLIARQAPGAAHRIPLFFCRSLLWILKVRLSVEGTRVTDRPVLLVANHVSWIDILVLGGIMPFCFLAKSEVAGWPILSAFAEVQGTVFVNRSRRRTIVDANRNMAARMRQGRSVLLFPEGTTVDNVEPEPFKSSHFAAAREFLRAVSEPTEVSVQPVAIAYSSRHAAWVGDAALLPHLWRTLRGPPLSCSIMFAPPIAYRDGSDRKVVARQSRGAIVACLEERRARHSVKRRIPPPLPEMALLPRCAETTS